MLELFPDAVAFAKQNWMPIAGGAAFMAGYAAIAGDKDYRRGWLTPSGARRHGLTGGNILLGRMGGPFGVDITAPKESFILAIGPTGHGKTKNLIENVIFSDTESSQVIFDLKGDLVEATAYARSLVGPVYILDPSGGPTNHYNPYGDIPAGDLAMIKDYHSWIVPQGSHDFYGPVAIELFQAAGTHVLHTAGYGKTMPGMHDLLTTENWIQVLKSSPVDAVRKIAANLDGNTAREIKASVLRYLGWLEYPSIQKMMSQSDFRLSDIQTSEKPCTVYIRLPEQSRTTMMPFARAVLGMLAMCLMKAERYSVSGEEKKRGVTIVIDEAKQLALPNIDVFYAAARSAGCRIVMASQLISEIRKLYDKSVEGNSSTQLFTRTASFEESKYVSDILPKPMMREKKTTRRFAPTGLYSGRNTSVEEKEIPLLTQSDVMRLPKHKVLVGIVDGLPVRMRTIYAPRRFAEIRGKPFSVVNPVPVPNPWEAHQAYPTATAAPPAKKFQPRAKNARVAK